MATVTLTVAQIDALHEATNGQMYDRPVTITTHAAAPQTSVAFAMTPKEYLTVTTDGRII